MKTRDMKQHLLDIAGFSYNFDREIYVNRETRKVFSVEFVEDHDAKTLEECIREEIRENGWHFYFNHVPSDPVRRDLEAVLG